MTKRGRTASYQFAEENRSYATQRQMSGFDPISPSASTLTSTFASTSTCRFGNARGTARYQLPTSYWQRPLQLVYQEHMLLWPVGPVKGGALCLQLASTLSSVFVLTKILSLGVHHFFLSMFVMVSFSLA